MFGTRTNWLPKRIIIMLFGLVILAALGWPHSAFAVVRWSANLQVQSGDYTMLDGYGDWVQVPGYGTVWRPSVVQDWAPFEHGHWTWTNDGWTWVSYEPFGWLVYHYGYWYFDDQVGWFWIPGNDWSPARVQWNTFGDYSAWAPMPPPNHYWRDPWDRQGPRVWLVVNVNHFTDDDIWRQRVSDPPGRETFKRGIVRRAPTVKTVERFTSRQIAPVRIERERVAPPPVTNNPPANYVRPQKVQRNRIVLPVQEQTRVQQYAPQVERQVLVPKGTAPRQPWPGQQQQQQQQQQKKPVQRQKRTTRGH